MGGVAVTGVLSLMACERRDATPTPETAFRHSLSGDISGDYRPVDDGAMQPVTSLFIGQDEAFAAWEVGRRGAPPLILSLTGPQGEARVTPDTYVVTDDRIQMSGSAPGMGRWICRRGSIRESWRRRGAISEIRRLSSPGRFR